MIAASLFIINLAPFGESSCKLALPSSAAATLSLLIAWLSTSSRDRGVKNTMSNPKRCSRKTLASTSKTPIGFPTIQDRDRL